MNVFLNFLCSAAISFCSGLPDGNYKDPNNCYGFISCSNGLTYKMDCPAGLRYNYTIDQCDWPVNVPCDQGMCCTITPVYYQQVFLFCSACASFLWGTCCIGAANVRGLMQLSLRLSPLNLDSVFILAWYKLRLKKTLFPTKTEMISGRF